MADYYHPGLIAWFNYWDAWHKWAAQCPPYWHLIQYIKWLRRKPEYRKETTK